MMTRERELLQQALDALTNCLSEHGHRCNRCDSEIDEGGKLITALREALAAPEPVAWYLPSPDGDDSIFRDHRTVVACTGNKWEGFLPLYAAPPAAPAPAQPVPLTQDQIADCTRTAHRACDAKAMTRWSTEFARAIEAAHGITGGKP